MSGLKYCVLTLKVCSVRSVISPHVLLVSLRLWPSLGLFSSCRLTSCDVTVMEDVCLCVCVCCRQRKDELEQRMSSLQESRRELMVQLEGLMKLLKVTHTHYCFLHGASSQSFPFFSAPPFPSDISPLLVSPFSSSDCI